MNILARLAVIVFADPLKSLLEFRDPPPSLIKTKKRKGAHLWTTMGDHITVLVPSSGLIPLSNWGSGIFFRK